MLPHIMMPIPMPLSQRESYLRTLEQEREAILVEAYARKTPIPSSPSPSPSQRPHALDLGRLSALVHPNQTAYNDRGRLLDFRETVRQRQARLEFLRRRAHARRLAQKAREDTAMSECAIKRLPLPAARVRAATTIQRAYRAHRALAALARLHARIRAAAAAPPHPPGAPTAHAIHARTAHLHGCIAELGALSAALDAAPHTTADARVARAARRTADALRAALEGVSRAVERVHVHTGSRPADSLNRDAFVVDDDDDDGDYYYSSSTSENEAESESGSESASDSSLGEFELGTEWAVPRLTRYEGEDGWAWAKAGESDDGSDCAEEDFSCDDSDDDDDKVCYGRPPSPKSHPLTDALFAHANMQLVSQSQRLSTATRAPRRSSVSRPPSLGSIPEE